MIKRILYIVNLVFVLLLLGVYAGVRVSPEFIAELSLFSYIYPLLLVVNVLFCFFWLFFKWKYVFVPLAVVLIGVNFIPRFIGLNSEASDNEQSKSLSLGCDMSASYTHNKVHVFSANASLNKYGDVNITEVHGSLDCTDIAVSFNYAYTFTLLAIKSKANKMKNEE